MFIYAGGGLAPHDRLSHDKRQGPARAFRQRGRMLHQSFIARSRNALAITLTDDSAIASAARAGDSSQPNTG